MKLWPPYGAIGRYRGSDFKKNFSSPNFFPRHFMRPKEPHWGTYVLQAYLPTRTIGPCSARGSWPAKGGRVGRFFELDAPHASRSSRRMQSPQCTLLLAKGCPDTWSSAWGWIESFDAKPRPPKMALTNLSMFWAPFCSTPLSPPCGHSEPDCRKGRSGAPTPA